MKKLLLILVSMIVVASVAASALAADKIVVTHLGYSGHGQAWRDYVAQAAEDFMKENPNIQVDVLVTPSGEYGAKMNMMYASDAGLDIVELGLGAGSYASEGMFLNLNPYLERDSDVGLDSWPAPVINGYTLNGEVWGLPASLALWMSWFNSDLFSEAGLPNPNQLDENWTWDSLTSSAKKMTVDTNGDGIKETYGIDRLYGHWSNGLALVAAGAQMYERYMLPQKPNVNSPEAKNALRFVTDLYLKHQVAVPYGNSQLRNYYFWTGKSAIDVTDNPGIVGAYMKDVNFDWDVAKPVRGPEGPGTHLQVDGFEIMSNTKHADAAWQWLKYLIARKEGVAEFVKMTGRLPAFKGVHAMYKELVPYAPSSWTLMFETMAASTTKPIYVTNIKGLKQWKSGSLMGEVFTGKKSPDVALDEAQEMEEAAVQTYLAEQAATK